MFASHQELGKRDDDRRRPQSQQWPWKGSLRVRRRRLLMGALGAFLIWLFVHNIPTDLGSIDERMGRPLRPGHNVGGVEFGYRPPAAAAAAPKGGRNAAPNKEPTGPPPRSQVDSTEQDHYYAGPVKFYRLAKTLQGISRTLGHRKDNRNILFAAASLKSAANLMPVACEMARVDKNFVHFALLGREAVSLDDVLQINGLDRQTCDIFFHDGRCDYSEYSTDARAEVAVSGALGHINTYMHPQAIITDDSIVEETFFVKGLRRKAKELETPIIEVPKGKYEDFLWMTHLDSGGLTSWHKPTVNILIHAQPHSSGSLLRLLHSIKSADYAGLAYPDITIDLPADVEPFARDYLRDFEWPPDQDPSGPRQRKVKVHHRISTAKITTENNALRFLESFYPVDNDHSHVLLLSAQTELSPLYLHYLMYNVLQHRYSAYGSEDGDNLFGVVLSTPDAYLNGSTPFHAPTLLDTSKETKASEDMYVPFLWQAPNADAALVFGDIWVEVHDYLKNRLHAVHDPAAVHQPPTKQAKLVSESQPGWLEYMLELMRARGWRNLYPARQEAGAWATVHRDLFQKPEEFMTAPTHRGDASNDAKEDKVTDEEEPFLRAEPAAAQTQQREKSLEQRERDMVQHSQPLLAFLPYEDKLPEIGDLPLWEYSGEPVDRDEIQQLATKYRPTLRRQVGGCSASEASHDRSAILGKTDDLFCFVGQEDLEEVDLDEKTAKAITESDVSEPASYAVQDVKGSASDAVAAASEPMDSAAKQKLAHAQAQPSTTNEAAHDSAKKEQHAVPADKPLHGGGTMKAVVEDLGPPKASATKTVQVS